MTSRVKKSHLGSIHLQAEITIQTAIFVLELWPVFQAKIFGMFFAGQNSSRNSRPEFQDEIFQARISSAIII